MACEGLMCEEAFCKYESVEYKDGGLCIKYMCKGECNFEELDDESFKRGREFGIVQMQMEIIKRLSDENMKKLICEIADVVLKGGEE